MVKCNYTTILAFINIWAGGMAHITPSCDQCATTTIRCVAECCHTCHVLLGYCHITISIHKRIIHQQFSIPQPLLMASINYITLPSYTLFMNNPKNMDWNTRFDIECKSTISISRIWVFQMKINVSTNGWIVTMVHGIRIPNTTKEIDKWLFCFHSFNLTKY